jgi:hypothetical protein
MRGFVLLLGALIVHWLHAAAAQGAWKEGRATFYGGHAWR